MNKKAVMVFTKAEGLRMRHNHVEFCSPEYLAEIIAELIPVPTRMKKAQIRRWINSEWDVKPLKKHKMMNPHKPICYRITRPEMLGNAPAHSCAHQQQR